MAGETRHIDHHRVLKADDSHTRSTKTFLHSCSYFCLALLATQHYDSWHNDIHRFTTAKKQTGKRAHVHELCTYMGDHMFR